MSFTENIIVKLWYFKTKFYSSFGTLVLLCCSLYPVYSYAQNTQSAEDPSSDSGSLALNHLAALQSLSSLMLSPQQTCAASANNVVPNVSAYQCSCALASTAAESSSSATSPPVPSTDTKSHEPLSIEFSSINDNTFIQPLFGYYADDKGFTFQNNISIQKLKEDRGWTLTLSSGLYTRSPNDENSVNVVQANPSTPVQYVYNEYFVDVSKAELELRKGKSFQIIGAFGLESRNRNAGPLSLAANTQEKWHSLWNLYQFNYISPSGQTGYYYNSTYDISTLYNPDGSYHNTVNGPVGPYLYQDPIPADTVHIPKWTVDLRAGASLKKEIPFLCSCESTTALTYEADITPTMSLDKNSRAALTETADLQFDRLKKNAQNMRWNFTVANAAYYYPKSSSSSWGSEHHIRVSPNFYSNKKNQFMFSPFFEMQFRFGHQLFDEMNDTDMLGNIGFRLEFKR